jgi:hypothetical protein
MNNVSSDSSSHRELASSEGDFRLSEAAERRSYAFQYEQASLKGLVLTNGGAIISLLTFIGNSNAHFDHRGLFWSFVWFSIGLTLALLANLTGAISHNLTAHVALMIGYRARAKAVGIDGDIRTDRQMSLGNRLFDATMGLIAISLALFVAGSFVALNAIT